MKPLLINNCLCHCSAAVKRYLDQGNSYKRKHLNESSLSISEMGYHPGREHGSRGKQVLEK